MARERGAAALAAITSTGAQSSVATQRLRITTNGPHDVEALDAQFVPAPGTVDFGAVKVPIPADGSVVVEPSAVGRMQAVHVSVPEGRLSVSALASPRNGGLWPDLATEIDASLREGGARVRSFTGEWGRELHATTNGATSVFVGVDGPRWMLYGVATGPTRDAVALDARLRRMLRGTVVVRGKAPYPVRTVLPLTATSQLDGEAQGTPTAAPTMMLRAPASNGAAANGAAVNGAALNGAAVNGAAANGAAVDGPAANRAAVNAAAANGAALNGAASNGAVASGAAATGPATNGLPQAPAAASNGASYGAVPNGVVPNGVLPNGAVTHGSAANGAVAGGAIVPGVAPTGAAAYSPPPPYPSAPYGPWGSGPAPDTAATPAVASGTGTGPYNAGTNGVNGHRPSTNGVVPDNGAGTGGYPTGAVASGAHSTGAPVNGWTPTGAHPSGATPYGATPYGATPYGDGANGWAPAPSPTSTGGTPRRGVPDGWAHDTGNHRRGSDAADLSSAPYAAPYSAPSSGAEPRPATAIPELPGPSERPWEASAPAAPLPSWTTAEPVAPTAPPAASHYSPAPVEPTRERRSSWADPDDFRSAEPAPASSPSHWDPLSDPLPSGLDPLPERVTTWSDAVSTPSVRWPTESVTADAQPDAGTPLFDAATAFRPRATEPDVGPDVGTPLFDATSASDTAYRPAYRSAERREPAAHPDASTPRFDAASGGSHRSSERERHAATSRLGDAAGEPGGRRRKDPGTPPQAHGTSRLDLSRQTRRHGEPGDEPRSAVAPPAFSYEAADDLRPGRRRAPETPTTSTGRHGAGPTSVRHRDDARVRHADPETRDAETRDVASRDAENRHAAHPGPSSRVPPTQWAWPKEAPLAFDSPHEAPSGRRSADTGPTTWSAAELLDARNDGGRRRRGDSARHGHPDDPEEGRHHRPQGAP